MFRIRFQTLTLALAMITASATAQVTGPLDHSNSAQVTPPGSAAVASRYIGPLDSVPTPVVSESVTSPVMPAAHVSDAGAAPQRLPGNGFTSPDVRSDSDFERPGLESSAMMNRGGNLSSRYQLAAPADQSHGRSPQSLGLTVNDGSPVGAGDQSWPIVPRSPGFIAKLPSPDGLPHGGPYDFNLYYRDGWSFGHNLKRLYNPLEGPSTHLAGSPTVSSMFGAVEICDEWEGFCGSRKLCYGCCCGGLKANPGHLGLPWLGSCEACDRTVPHHCPLWGKKKCRDGSCGNCQKCSGGCGCGQCGR